MNRRCVIIDDDPIAITLVEKAIVATTGLTLLACSTDPVAAYNEIASGAIVTDIVFMDVDMPNINGMQLASLIKPYAVVIFVTGHPQYSLEAFDKDVADFLLKPFTYERFVKAVQRAEALLSQPKDFFFVKVKSKMQKIYKSQIIYVESKRNSICFLLKENRVYETLGNMEEMMVTLGNKDFMRVHQSFIVNLAAIESLEGNMLALEGKKEVPIGRTYKEAVMEYINRHLPRK
ncbi:LytR/AlgR family response regulator transcription factor [Niabella sp. CJ426]|uniref:LytR/AlgR family response regulator transcription factor n=1 Tax=Niabella sp. CJ426 TaxID=3393740 RepID=UPI003D01E0DC